MKLNYYPDTDSLYIDLANRPSVDSLEVSDDIVLDVDAEGRATGIDIQHASRVADLSTLEAGMLPLTAPALSAA